MPRESARGQCALAAEPAFARPFCLADSFGSVFPPGARGRLWPGGPAGWGKGAEAAGEAHVR